MRYRLARVRGPTAEYPDLDRPLQHRGHRHDLRVFADELWWRVHEKGKYADLPAERVRLSLVIGGKPEPDRMDYASGRSALRLKEAA